MSASLSPDNPAKRNADLRMRSIEILNSNPGMTAQQAQLQAKKEMSSKISLLSSQRPPAICIPKAIFFPVGGSVWGSLERRGVS
mgnify:CR=1 FL=1